MTPAGADLDSVRDPDHLSGDEAVARVAFAELTILAVTPALDRAAYDAVDKDAGVLPAGADLTSVRDSAHLDRSGAVERGAVAELAILALAPALDAAAGEQGAGVPPAGADGHCATSLSDLEEEVGVTGICPQLEPVEADPDPLTREELPHPHPVSAFERAILLHGLDQLPLRALLEGELVGEVRALLRELVDESDRLRLGGGKALLRQVGGEHSALYRGARKCAGEGEGQKKRDRKERGCPSSPRPEIDDSGR